MKIGTYYYPEQWPREQWERDFDRIVSLGLGIVHMGEFAWYQMEPSAGDIQLDWLSECVEMAKARKLDVILCTPTAAPPVWLSDQYPEILGVAEDGTRDRHGGRRHYTPTSPRFQEATMRIVEALAVRFGDHPSVVGWQIDNEFGHAFDQSENTHKAFRQWLRKKYTTIDALNVAWGNQFWNQYYQSFDQIRMPASREPNYRNPHECLDASRFWSRAWADFTKLQADILKRHVGTRWITTNFMPFYLDCDPGDMRESLDLFTWDSYPITGFGSNFKDESFRFGDPAAIDCWHDAMRSYTGRWGLMEVQPGQMNWSGVPSLPYTGAIRLLLWNAIAQGCEFITVYRLRQPRFGIEMWHDGLVVHDGVSLSPGGQQFKQVATEVRALDFEAPSTAAAKQPRAGLIIDFDQLWWTATVPQAKKWSQAELICQWHQALARMGFAVDVIRPNEPWPDDLRVVVAPGMQMIDDRFIAQLTAYVEGGGHLVFTPRTALQDRNGQFFEADRASSVKELIGGEVEAYDGLPDATDGLIEFEGATFKWQAWGELLFADEGTRVWAKYANMFYAGAPAITHRKHKSGTVTYCGVFGGRDLAEAVIEKLAEVIDHRADPLPDRVRVMQRGAYTIALNFSDKTVPTPAPKDTSFILGSRQLAPAGVAIWKA